MHECVCTLSRLVKNCYVHVQFVYCTHRSKELDRDQARELLKIIRQRGTSAFDKFVEVLLDSETQASLGKLLKESSWRWKVDDDKYGTLYIPTLNSMIV